MNKIATLVVGLIGLWALFQFGARNKAPVIQDDIQTRTEKAIAAIDLTEVQVSVDGRDVVPREAARRPGPVSRPRPEGAPSPRN